MLYKLDPAVRSHRPPIFTFIGNIEQLLLLFRWPTIPLVFIKGVLIGGATDFQALIASGEFKELGAKTDLLEA